MISHKIIILCAFYDQSMCKNEPHLLLFDIMHIIQNLPRLTPMADEAFQTLLNLVITWGKTTIATVIGTVHTKIAIYQAKV